mgnify:FL=1|tara:strand:+ start:560 stop:964 length:405 start_codon:yes stop_codon:yes gene_type:complete
MEKIYSKIDKSLICCHVSKKDATQYRNDMGDTSEILQSSVRLLDEGTHVKPHKHLPIIKQTIGTQEAWIVIEGKILAKIYDINDEYLLDLSLISGDMMVFYRGGHELLATKETIFYELKTGPYYGYENDKEPIS